MKCEESLAVIEEFVDGELDQINAERLSAHLSSCATCADEYETLTREQLLYARYERDVEVAPALWAAVQTGIEAQRSARASRPRLRSWFAGALEGLPLNPAWTTALLIIALGLTFGVIFYARVERSAPEKSASVDPRHPENSSGTVAVNKISDEGALSHDNASSVPPVPPQTAMWDAKNAVRPDQISAGRLSSKKRVASLEPPSNAPAETSSAANHVEMLEGPSPLDSPDLQTARHIESAELLLRAFRNSQSAGGGQSPDISYEKQRSRELLADNILRRREAETEGNIRTEELLSSLEPILLDIANLPDKPSLDDVLTIKERMRKTEIIAALQFH